MNLKYADIDELIAEDDGIFPLLIINDNEDSMDEWLYDFEQIYPFISLNENMNSIELMDCYNLYVRFLSIFFYRKNDIAVLEFLESSFFDRTLFENLERFFHKVNRIGPLILLDQDRDFSPTEITRVRKHYFTWFAILEDNKRQFQNYSW